MWALEIKLRSSHLWHLSNPWFSMISLLIWRRGTHNCGESTDYSSLLNVCICRMFQPQHVCNWSNFFFQAVSPKSFAYSVDGRPFFSPTFHTKIWVTLCLSFCHTHIGPTSDHVEFESIIHLKYVFLVYTVALLPMTQPLHCMASSVLSPGLTNVLACSKSNSGILASLSKIIVKLFPIQRSSPGPHTPNPGLPYALWNGLLPWGTGPLSSSSSAIRVASLLPPACQEHPRPLFCLYSVIILPHTPALQHFTLSKTLHWPHP